jgi:hypothetical protein
LAWLADEGDDWTLLLAAEADETSRVADDADGTSRVADDAAGAPPPSEEKI